MAVMRTSETRSRVEHRVGAEEHVGTALRFAGGVAAAGLAFLVVAALWVSTCTESLDVDTAACGAPQRTLLGLGAPAILFGGAVWAFLRTYQTWRARDHSWAWQGAGFFLFTVMLVTLALGFPALAGPAFGG